MWSDALHSQAHALSDLYSCWESGSDADAESEPAIEKASSSDGADGALLRRRPQGTFLAVCAPLLMCCAFSSAAPSTPQILMAA